MKLVIFFIFVHISILLPGYVIARNLRLLKNKPDLHLSLGYFISIVFFAALALTHYVFNTPPMATRVVFWIVLLVAFVLFLYQKLYIKLLENKLLLACLIGMTLLSSAFIGLRLNGPLSYIPDPQKLPDRNYNTLSVKVLNVAQTNANDNYIPYRQAQFFINRSNPQTDSFINEWGVNFFQRTPLMGAVAAQYFNALADSLPISYTWSSDARDTDFTYAKFQIIAQILNAVFIIPAFYLIMKLFDKKTAQLSMFFIVPSHFFLYNAAFTWPKSFVAFFVLLAWLLILEKKLVYVVLAGLASGFAYLAHDLAVLYIGASLVFLLANKRWKDAFIYSGISIIPALPWLYVSSFVFKRPSSFIYYPMSLKGIPQLDQHGEIIQEFLKTSPLRLLAIRIESLFYLVSPYQIIYSDGGQAIGRRLWALGLYSLPGSVGIGLIIPTFLGLFSKFRMRKDVFIFITIPLLLAVILTGWPKGLGSLHFAEALVVLLIAIASRWLSKKKPWVAIVAYMFCAIQLLLMIGYSYRFNFATWLGAENILLCVVILAVIMLCGIGIANTLRVNNQPSSA